MHQPLLDDMSADDIADINECTRRFVGKPIEACDVTDFRRVHQALREDIEFLRVMRDQAIHEAEVIVDRGRRRREERERREGA